MAHFYGHENRWGVGTTSQRRDGTFDPLPGTICRFNSRTARDAWVDADTRHREAIRAGSVRSEIARANRRGGRAYWENFDFAIMRELNHEYLVCC